MDGNLRESEVTAIDFDLSLKEMRTRVYTMLENLLESSSRENLESTRHVAKVRANKEVGKESASPAYKITFPRASANAASRHEPTAKNAIVALGHF